MRLFLAFKTCIQSRHMPRRKCKYRWLPMVIVYTAETWHHRIALEVVLVKVEYLHAGRWLWVHHLPNSPCIPLCPKHILAESRPKIPSTRALLNPRSPSPSRPAVPLPPAAPPPGQGRSKVERTLPTPAVGGRSSPGHSRLAVSSGLGGATESPTDALTTYTRTCTR